VNERVAWFLYRGLRQRGRLTAYREERERPKILSIDIFMFLCDFVSLCDQFQNSGSLMDDLEHSCAGFLEST
jgi:hypothetical protein